MLRWLRRSSSISSVSKDASDSSNLVHFLQTGISAVLEDRLNRAPFKDEVSDLTYRIVRPVLGNRDPGSFISHNDHQLLVLRAIKELQKELVKNELRSES